MRDHAIIEVNRDGMITAEAGPVIEAFAVIARTIKSGLETGALAPRPSPRAKTTASASPAERSGTLAFCISVSCANCSTVGAQDSK